MCLCSEKFRSKYYSCSCLGKIQIQILFMLMLGKNPWPNIIRARARPKNYYLAFPGRPNDYWLPKGVKIWLHNIWMVPYLHSNIHLPYLSTYIELKLVNFCHIAASFWPSDWSKIKTGSGAYPNWQVWVWEPNWRWPSH